MSWTPRSERLGLREHGPYDGVPRHLERILTEWLGTHTDYDRLSFLAVRLGVTVPEYYTVRLETVWEQCDEDQRLDLLEGTLYLNDGTGAAQLRHILAAGGSALTVGPDDQTLVDVVDPTVAQMAAEAARPGDAAAEELSAAWAAAFGRGPDPSDAWDHAIKAVENVLIPLAEPKNKEATLNSAVSAIANSPDRWQTTFPQRETRDVEPIVGMLRMIWPNPDRHGGIDGASRPPTLEEARAVVTLAASLVQLGRSGDLVSRR